MVWSDDGIGASLRESFDRAAAELPERVRQMDEFRHEDERCLLRLWSASHARPEHVQRVDEPSALLAFVGNPTLVGESDATWPALLKDSLNRRSVRPRGLVAPVLRISARPRCGHADDRGRPQRPAAPLPSGGSGRDCLGEHVRFLLGVVGSRIRSRGGDGVGDSGTLHHRTDVLSRSSPAWLRRGHSPPAGRRNDTGDLGPDS